MFIKFENGLAHETVECRSYTVEPGEGSQRLIHVDDDLRTEWIVGVPHWDRAYVMNADGRTIDTILPSARVVSHG